MFSVLGRVRADGSWDDAKKKLFNFTKPSRTIQDPENFGALVDQAIRKHCKRAISQPVKTTGQVRNMKVIQEIKDIKGNRYVKVTDI